MDGQKERFYAILRGHLQCTEACATHPVPVHPFLTLFLKIVSSWSHALHRPGEKGNYIIVAHGLQSYFRRHAMSSDNGHERAWAGATVRGRKRPGASLLTCSICTLPQPEQEKDQQPSVGLWCTSFWYRTPVQAGRLSVTPTMSRHFRRLRLTGTHACDRSTRF